MQSESITLTRYQPAGPAPLASPPVAAPAQSDTLLGGLGTFGTLTAFRTAALCVAQGTLPPLFSLDNAAGLPSAVPLPDGRRLEFPLTPQAHLYLHSPDRRTQLGEYSLLTARYAPLLRGLSVAGTYRQGGYGGGAVPLLSLIDVDLHIAAIRTHVRRALQAAARPPAAAGGVLGALADRASQPRHPLFVLLTAGVSGSCGAALAQIAGYLIRQEAGRLGLPRPTVWLLLAGPQAFQGLTPRTLVNCGATLEGLQHLARHGIDRLGIDGQAIREAAPPYDYVWLLDDPQLPGDGNRVTDAELAQFSWRVAAAARLLLQPSIRAAYLDHVANREGEQTVEWPQFGTLQLGLGGFDPALLTAQVAAELACRRADALATVLAN